MIASLDPQAGADRHRGAHAEYTSSKLRESAAWNGLWHIDAMASCINSVFGGVQGPRHYLATGSVLLELPLLFMEWCHCLKASFIHSCRHLAIASGTRHCTERDTAQRSAVVTATHTRARASPRTQNRGLSSFSGHTSSS